MSPKDDRDSRDESAPTMTGRGRMPRPSGPLDLAGERYRIDDVIAKGGMGEVLTAHDDQIGRTVAIKRMIEAEPDPIDVERFLREARIQGRLDHPAIVPVYELARDRDGRPYFAMKQLSGRTLASVLDGHVLGVAATIERFPRQRLLRALADVCLAIELAHNRGVVHRDLKPANIMLGDFGEVYVIDWGIARVADDPHGIDARLWSASATANPEPPDHRAGVTVPGSQLGTPGYMSPEQIASDPDLDGRTDVYALGCILFEILTGSTLHPESAAGIISAVDGYDGRDVLEAPERDVPPELAAACLAAVAADRDERLGSARELGERIQRYLDGDRDLARRRALAAEHLARATAALAGPDDVVAGTANALRDAGRALALDPTCTEAADLVGRLLLAPPVETPPAVVREIAAADVVEHRRFARLAAIGYQAYLLAAVLMVALGIRDGRYLAAVVGLVAVHTALAWTGTRSAIANWRTIAQLLIHAAMAALLTRMFGPIIAPGAAAATAMAFVAHPQLVAGWRVVVSVAVMVAAIAAPIVAELAGLIPATIIADGDVVVLRSPAVHYPPVVTELTFLGWSAVLIAVATAIAWANTRRDRTNRHLLRLHAWRLRQLAPDFRRGSLGA